jgi:hypothetical protein
MSFQGYIPGEHDASAMTPCVYYVAAGWWAKREDLACYTISELPSGAKVRQYAAMIAAAPADAVLAIGCSAASAMQVYVAGMHVTTGRPAYVVVPRRRVRHPSTTWAVAAGAHLEEVAPGYPSQYRARLRAWLAEQGRTAVPWDRRLAALDTAAQVANLPAAARRIIIPSGSGLTAAGVIGGLLGVQDDTTRVVVFATSRQGSLAHVRALAAKYFGPDTAGIPVDYLAPRSPYDRPLRGVTLPNGTALDPWYAAKAVSICQPGDVLWITGRRPEGAT